MKANLATLGFGALFGFVLGWARLHEPATIYRMLRLMEPDVFLIMGSAIATATFGARLLRRTHARTWIGAQPVSWTTAAPTRRHVVGSILFGLGWSVACVCPGPAAVVARYGARAPVAESRLRYDAERAEVELVSDASEGPYAGVHRFAALEFLARLVDHIPAKGEVRVRYYGAYASRRRGWWRRRGVVLAGTGPQDAHETEHEAEPWPALRARRRRWAELLRRVFQVEVEVCPRCGGEMSIVGFVTEHAVVTRILAHLARRGIEARAGPWAAAAVG